MRATESLSSDHRLIERVITAIENAADRLEHGTAVPAQYFLDAARFIAEFADGLHHRKEEGVLFESMAEHGMPTDTGPIAVMLYEHDQGREFTAGMRAGAERLAAGDREATSAILENARGYAALLRQHIRKEDQILFPMAAQVIPRDRHDELMLQFERIERAHPGGGVAAYLALAEHLEATIA